VLVAVIDYPPRPLNFTIMVREVWNHIFSPSYVLRDNWPEHLALLIMLGLVPLLILDWIAVAWTSMWLSLRVKRAITAPIAAVFLVHLPPWFFWAVTMTWLDYKKWIPQEEFSQMLVGYLLIATFIVANQVLWSAFCRRQLLKNFRTAATDRYQPPRKLRWWQIRIA